MPVFALTQRLIYTIDIDESIYMRNRYCKQHIQTSVLNPAPQNRKRSPTHLLVYLSVILLFSCASLPATEKDKKKRLLYEDDNVLMRVITRSPKQIAAFYEGREFERGAIAETTKFCFPAVIVKNKTNDVLWLILDDWQFLSGETPPKPINRIKRPYWKQRWQAVGLSTAHQSTFGWTLMPASRNLQVDEAVGGNIPIEMQDRPYTLTANFKTGQSKQGKVISVTIKNIPCPKDENVK